MRIFFTSNILPPEDMVPGCDVLMSFYDFHVQKMDSVRVRFRAYRQTLEKKSTHEKGKSPSPR